MVHKAVHRQIDRAQIHAELVEIRDEVTAQLHLLAMRLHPSQLVQVLGRANDAKKKQTSPSRTSKLNIFVVGLVNRLSFQVISTPLGGFDPS
jgi:hypothetical protein